ncbi:MAG: TM2 domain-containing protein [Flavobacteriaceae bacterium]|nr:TM2 domain-containing protein [Flavobacteriaceae bacterium]
MEAQKVDMFLMMNAKMFESSQISVVRDVLLGMDESKWVMIQSIDYKDPTTSILISIFAGGLGIDRFYIGQTGLGIAKLLTCGGLGIWALVDLFLIMGESKKVNFENFMRYAS